MSVNAMNVDTPPPAIQVPPTAKQPASMSIPCANVLVAVDDALI